MNKIGIIVGTVMVTGIASCSSDEPVVEQIDDFGYQAIQLSQVEAQIADASYSFGWNLLEMADATKPDGNVCVSPVSASVVLTMLINGADGETRSEIVRVLGLEGLSLDEINDNSRFLTSKLFKNDKDVDIFMANSMWIVNDIPVNASYKNCMTDIFGAYVANTTKTNYVADVNAWCDKQTKGLIPQMIEENESSDLTLLNTLYFKNVWDKKVKFSTVGNGVFNNRDGRECSVPYISGNVACGYIETGVAKYARISFKDSNYALLIGLPNINVSINECILELKNVDFLDAGYKNAKVDLRMPEFSVEGKQSLKEMMILLGIDSAFGDEAQFPYISGLPMYVSRFDQGFSFKVDEKGAVASSVTNAGITSWATYPTIIDEPMVVNRPFVFAIYEYSTKCLLFVGKIESL